MTKRSKTYPLPADVPPAFRIDPRMRKHPEVQVPLYAPEPPWGGPADRRHDSDETDAIVIDLN